jgi:hypothetical protein
VSQSYQKAVETMDLVFQTELQRLKVQTDLTDEVAQKGLTPVVEKFEYIYDQMQGRGRE